MAHGHPRFSKGGAEIAAFQLFQALNARDDCDAWFLARHGNTDSELAHEAIRPIVPGSREYLYAQDSLSFDFSATDVDGLAYGLRNWLACLRPDVVHFHHYIHLGIETFRLVRNCLPESKILLTLHELLAICASQGLMIKSSGRLCERSGPHECHECVPERDPEDFRLRQRYIRNSLSVVDHFVSPSRFVRQRYIDWGLPNDKIMVLENGQPETALAPLRPPKSDPEVVFGYFGQISPYKGIEVLLVAFSSLPNGLRQRTRLEIHGGGHERFGAGFNRRIERAFRKAPTQVVRCGSYEPGELGVRMAGVDWLVLPSIAWENSPLVIQEAMRHRRPVICSGIGGMAEKVRNDADGLHVTAGDPETLARALQRAVVEPGLLPRLRQGIRAPATIAQSAATCMDIYHNL